MLEETVNFITFKSPNAPLKGLDVLRAQKLDCRAGKVKMLQNW